MFETCSIPECLSNSANPSNVLHLPAGVSEDIKVPEQGDAESAVKQSDVLRRVPCSLIVLCAEEHGFDVHRLDEL
jgi:hypothetical protein